MTHQMGSVFAAAAARCSCGCAEITTNSYMAFGRLVRVRRDGDRIDPVGWYHVGSPPRFMRVGREPRIPAPNRRQRKTSILSGQRPALRLLAGPDRSAMGVGTVLVATDPDTGLRHPVRNDDAIDSRRTKYVGARCKTQASEGCRQHPEQSGGHPTAPSSDTSSSFFASTANSIGSSRKTCLQKPSTIIDTASSSPMPRLRQ